MYDTGKGVPQDFNEAVKWYHKAAEQGLAAAQYNLGFMYQNGKGVPQSDAEAVKWFRKATEKNHAYAQTWLGWMYENGKGVPQSDTEAVKWYRKAAEQGYADAQKFLDKIKVKNVSSNKDDGKTLSKQENDAILSDSATKKTRPVSRHLSDAEECKALLDACTHHLYMHNAFRISGIPTDASTHDSKRQMDELKDAAKAGDLQDELIHAFALDPVPTLDQIGEAAQKIQDPEQRIIDEFFWFWPFEPGKSDNDSALKALKHCDYDKALKIWLDVLSENHIPRSTVAKHNLAVMYHLKALDSELNALKGDLSAEQLFAISKDWRTCFKWWEELADDEALWSLVAGRIRIVDDPRLTTGFARRMRATLPAAMDEINAKLAIDFAERGKWEQAINHINYMKETHQGKDDVRKTLSNITKPLKVRVESAVKKAISIAGKKPAQAAEAASELLKAVSEPLKIIRAILPPEDHERIDLFDTVAEACLKCQISYARESEDWAKSLKILDAASKYAASKETIDRLAENRLEVKIKNIDSNGSIASKMHSIENEIIPHLSYLKSAPGMTEDVYEKCADIVARYIRELSVSEYNENDNLIGALRILEISISVACGREVRKKLQEDKDQLINIQKEATKHNLKMQIKSDEIEVTNKFVRYNNQKIPISSIQGIKYGAFIKVTNGIRSSSYLIDITDGQSRRIKIECKRLFRNEAQAERDFNGILEALYHQVIPALVQSLAEQILNGMPLQVGGCRLTNEGMYITTGALLWKKETLAPFSDLRFSSYSGQITASSVKDKRISISMAIRDIWNAALLEFVTKAVVEMKAKR